MPPWDWQADAKQTLEGALLNKEAPLAERLIAAKLAGNAVAISDELAVALMEVLGSASKPEDLRARAVLSFGPVLETCHTGEFGDPYDPRNQEMVFEGIKRLLHMLYHEDSVPKLVRRKILEVSVRARRNGIRTRFSALQTKDPEWVLTAVFCMQYVKGFERDSGISREQERTCPHECDCRGGREGSGRRVGPYLRFTGERGNDAETVIARRGGCDCRGPEVDTPSLEILNHLVDSDDKDVSEVADEAFGFAGAYTYFDEDDLGDNDASGCSKAAAHALSACVLAVCHRRSRIS